jgi:hypothetical protein
MKELKFGGEQYARRGLFLIRNTGFWWAKWAGCAATLFCLLSGDQSSLIWRGCAAGRFPGPASAMGNAGITAKSEFFCDILKFIYRS